MEAGKDEIVVFALPRHGAEAMAAGAEVGLDQTLHEVAVDVDAGWATLQVFKQTLKNEPDAELVLVANGIRALDALLSHDRDLLVIDADAGTGLLDADGYRDLGALLGLLRDAKVDVERDEVLARIRGAVEEGHAKAMQLDAEDQLNGTDDMLDLIAAHVADEFSPRVEGRSDGAERQT